MILELESALEKLTRDPSLTSSPEGFRILSELTDAVTRLTRPERVDRVRRLLTASHRLLDEAIEFAKIDGLRPGQRLRTVAGIVTLFSGGNDSTTLAHIFRNRVTHVGMANTGIGLEKTRQYVRDTATSWGLPILEKHPEPGYGYEDFLFARAFAKTGPNKGTLLYPGGFPGPAAHKIMYQRLKERAFEQMRGELVKHSYQERAVFIAGRRATESDRRKHLAFRVPIERKGAMVWAAPLINWTKMDLNTYRTMYPDVPRNEVSDLIHMSGECLCACFAHENELDEISEWFPEFRAYIDDLERRLLASGVAPPERCVWGWGWNKRGSATGPDACECRTA